MRKRENKSVFANAVLAITLAVIGIIVATGVTLAIANGSHFTATMTFNEDDDYSTLRIDPKSGMIKAGIELTQGSDNTTYKVYYRRASFDSYQHGATFYKIDVGDYEGTQDLVDQIGWRNWDIKTVQTNNLSSDTYKIEETIKLD